MSRAPLPHLSSCSPSWLEKMSPVPSTYPETPFFRVPAVYLIRQGFSGWAQKHMRLMAHPHVESIYYRLLDEAFIICDIFPLHTPYTTRDGCRCCTHDGYHPGSRKEHKPYLPLSQPPTGSPAT